MSSLDGAFIKAYGRVEIDGLSGSDTKAQPEAGKLPEPIRAPGTAVALDEIIDGPVKPRDRIQIHRLSRSQQRKTRSGRTSQAPDTSPDHPRPRLAMHTIVEEENAQATAADPTPMSPSDVARTEPSSDGLLQEIPAPKFLSIEDVAARATGRTRGRPTKEIPVSPASDSDGSEPWTIAVDQFKRPQAAFQVTNFAWPAACEMLADSAGDRFMSLCETLIDGMRQQRKLLGVGSCRAGSGATTLLLTLASQIASVDLHVAVVDADLARPSLADALAVLPHFSWYEVVADDLPLEECWIEATMDQVTLLPLIKPVRNIDVKHADQISNLAGAVRGAFDLTLIDLGCVDNAATVRLLAALPLDGMVLVQDCRSTSDADVASIRQQLGELAAPWWGVAQNFV